MHGQFWNKDNCYLYSTNNSGWRHKLNPYNHYEEEIAFDLESVFEEFMAYHASSKANQNSMQNHEIHFGKSYSLEDYQREEELQTYYQNGGQNGHLVTFLGHPG